MAIASAALGDYERAVAYAFEALEMFAAVSGTPLDRLGVASREAIGLGRPLEAAEVSQAAADYLYVYNGVALQRPSTEIDSFMAVLLM